MQPPREPDARHLLPEVAGFVRRPDRAVNWVRAKSMAAEAVVAAAEVVVAEELLPQPAGSARTRRRLSRTAAERKMLSLF